MRDSSTANVSCVCGGPSAHETRRRLTREHTFDSLASMDDIEAIKGELERERRSLAMLSPNAPISREKAIDLIRKCQAAIAAAQGRIG